MNEIPHVIKIAFPNFGICTVLQMCENCEPFTRELSHIIFPFVGENRNLLNVTSFFLSRSYISILIEVEDGFNFIIIWITDNSNYSWTSMIIIWIKISICTTCHLKQLQFVQTDIKLKLKFIQTILKNSLSKF